MWVLRTEHFGLGGKCLYLLSYLIDCHQPLPFICTGIEALLSLLVYFFSLYK